MFYLLMPVLWFLVLVAMLTVRWMNPDVENRWTDWRAVGLVSFFLVFNLLRAFLWNQKRQRERPEPTYLEARPGNKPVVDPTFDFKDDTKPGP